MKKMKVAALGDNCVDIYPRLGRYYCTGNVVDFAVHMQRLGIPVPDLLRRVLLRSKRKVERRVDEAVGGDDDAP